MGIGYLIILLITFIVTQLTFLECVVGYIHKLMNKTHASIRMEKWIPKQGFHQCGHTCFIAVLRICINMVLKWIYKQSIY